MLQIHMQVITICQMAYGIPSFILLCFFFCLPFCYRKKLGNPFYRLLQIDIIVNLTCYINTWLAIRIYHFEFGSQFLVLLESSIPGTLTLSKVLIVAYFHMQNVTGLSLVLYRFTSVLYLKSEQYWSRWYFIVPVFTIVWSFTAISPWWIDGNYITRISVVNGVLQKKVDEKKLFMHATINPIFSAFYFLLILLIGVSTTIQIENRGKKSHSNRHRKFVKKLTRVIVCNSVLMSGNLIFLFGTSIVHLFLRPLDVASVKAIIVTFTSDMVTLPMPYILLVFDSNIRRILKLESSSATTGKPNSRKTITN